MFANLFARKVVPFEIANQAVQSGIAFDRVNATIKRSAMAQENSLPREPLPIAGTTVEFVNTDSRFTVSRFLLTGVFAFALKKHTNYFIFTTADGTEYGVRVRGMNGGKAQQWVREFNNLSRTLSREQEETEPTS